MSKRHPTIADVRATMEHAAYYIEQYGIPDPAELRDAAHAMEEILGGMWTELEKARDMLVCVAIAVDNMLRLNAFDAAFFDKLGNVIEDATAELEANEPAPLYRAAPDLLDALETAIACQTDDWIPKAQAAIAKAKEARK